VLAVQGRQILPHRTAGPLGVRPRDLASLDPLVAAGIGLDHAGVHRKALAGDQPRLHAPADDALEHAPQDIALPEAAVTRLGGVYNIAPVVDDLIDRVMTDARLNANPRVDEAHHRVSAAGFKYFVTEMVCQAAGGPQRYSGRPMGDSHRHLMITEGEWEAFQDDLQQALDRFGVPQPEQEELKAIVESTREAIVIAPLQEGAAGPAEPR
jgi:hemoglobin